MKSYSFIEKSEKLFLDGDLETALDNVYQALQDAALDYVREAGLVSSLEFSGESQGCKGYRGFRGQHGSPAKTKVALVSSGVVGRDERRRADPRQDKKGVFGKNRGGKGGNFGNQNAP